jgi:hypothetical protein
MPGRPSAPRVMPADHPPDPPSVGRPPAPPRLHKKSGSGQPSQDFATHQPCPSARQVRSDTELGVRHARQMAQAFSDRSHRHDKAIAARLSRTVPRRRQDPDPTGVTRPLAQVGASNPNHAPSAWDHRRAQCPHRSSPHHGGHAWHGLAGAHWCP